MSEMKHKIAPLVLLVAALAGVGASIGWAVSRMSNGGYGHGPGYGMGYSMMAASGQRTAWYLNGSGKPVPDIASARARAQSFADRLGLKTGEVMQFRNNFYVLLTDQQGKPATEVLVDPQTGLVALEYGPAMMWNTRYGMMRGTGARGYGGMMGGSAGGMMGGGYGGMMGGSAGGMMGRYGGSPNWTPPSGSVSGPLTVSEAQRVADRWLASQGSGLIAGQPDALPGYFTFHTLKNGKITGMLSVNRQTGAVWYHWWHGRFITMAE